MFEDYMSCRRKKYLFYQEATTSNKCANSTQTKSIHLLLLICDDDDCGEIDNAWLNNDQNKPAPTPEVCACRSDATKRRFKKKISRNVY